MNRFREFFPVFISPPVSNLFYYKDSLIKNRNRILIIGTYTLNPRSGLVSAYLKTFRIHNTSKHQGFVNKIGFRNDGIHRGLERYEKLKRAGNRSVISISGLSENEWNELNKIIPKDINLELNIGCPNIEKEKENYKLNILQQFLHSDRFFCIVKVPPTIKIEEIDKLYDLGFRQFHCSNTMKTEKGGISGTSLIERNKKLIKKIKNRYPDAYIIAGGGIYEVKNAREYINSDCDFISLSTYFFHRFLKK